MRPALDVDFIPASEQDILLRLAAVNAVGMGKVPPTIALFRSGVQIPILEMLLAPMKTVPSITFQFLGLSDLGRGLNAINGCLDVILTQLREFVYSNGNRCSDLASTGFEVIYRVCIECQSSGEQRLEQLLKALMEKCKNIINDEYFLFVPKCVEIYTPDAKQAEAWHFQIAALALLTLCNSRNRKLNRIHIQQIVGNFFPGYYVQDSVLISSMASWCREDLYHEKAPPDRYQEECKYAYNDVKLSMLNQQTSGMMEQIDLEKFEEFFCRRIERIGEDFTDDDEQAIQEALDWASEMNDFPRLANARINIVKGWEQLLTVCFTKAPEAVPDLLSSEMCKGMLRKTIDMLVEHPSVEVRFECILSLLDSFLSYRGLAFVKQMRLVEPLARSAATLARELRFQYRLLGPDGQNSQSAVQILDIDEAGEILESLLDGIGRQVGVTGRRIHPTAEYRGALALALSHLLEFLTAPRDPTDLLLDYNETSTIFPLDILAHLCAQYKVATTTNRKIFRSKFQHKYESVVTVLAHDGCSESTTPKWRVACLRALALILKALHTDDMPSSNLGSNGESGEANGLYLSAKVLEILWRDHHLERIVGIGFPPGTSLGISTSVDRTLQDVISNLPDVWESAQACLMQLALTELGANALQKLSLVTNLIRSVVFWEREAASPTASSNIRKLRLIKPCRILTSMLGSIPFHEKLVEDILRWVQAVRHPISEVLKMPVENWSIEGIEDATAVISLLANVIGSIEPARRDSVIHSFLRPDKYANQSLATLTPLSVVLNECINGSWEILHKLKLLRQSPSSSGASDAWTSLKPRNQRESDLSRVESLPSPPRFLQAWGWNAFCSLKLSTWWDLSRSVALLLQRTARLSHLGVLPECSDRHYESLALALWTSCDMIKSFQDGNGVSIVGTSALEVSTYYADVQDSCTLVAENLMAFAVERMRILTAEGSNSNEKMLLLNKLAGTQNERRVLSEIEKIYGPTSNYAPPQPSDVFLRKAVRYIDEAYRNTGI